MKKKQTDRHIPTRMCVGCRKKTEKSSLLRIVVTENGAVVDKTQKINQRGFYVCKDKVCLQRLLKNKGMLKSLSQQEKQNLVLEVEKYIDEQ